jgi:hypothetical protein
MWRLSRTSSYSYPRVAVIWIDVHHAGETWYTRHVRFLRRSMYVTCVLSAGSHRTWEPFTLTQQSWTDSLLLRKKCSRLHLSARLRDLWDPSQFLSQHNYWNNVLKSNICWQTCYIGLLGLYHQHGISTFNTCSRRSTHWSLTGTGWGYKLRGVGLSHHTSWPSQLTAIRFPPKGLVRTQIKQSSITNWTKRDINPNLVSGTPSLDFYRSLSCKNSNY